MNDLLHIKQFFKIIDQYQYLNILYESLETGKTSVFYSYKNGLSLSIGLNLDQTTIISHNDKQCIIGPILVKILYPSNMLVNEDIKDLNKIAAFANFIFEIFKGKEFYAEAL